MILKRFSFASILAALAALPFVFGGGLRMQATAFNYRWLGRNGKSTNRRRFPTAL